MSLYKLNFLTADKIIELYSQLLVDLPNMHLNDKYGYSDMRGYDLIDISNSLALMTAYRVFQANKIDKLKLEEFKEMADQDGNAIFQYLFHFIPDNEKYELSKLDKNSPDFLLKSIILQSKSQESETWEKSMKYESAESFLNFCIQTKEDEPSKYWHLVFERLKIECDTSENYDRIYFELKTEQNKTLKEVESKIETSSQVIKEEIKELNEKEVEKFFNASFYTRYKTDLLNFIFVGIFFFCFFNVFVKNVFFIFLICFNIFMIIFSLREKLYTTLNMKFNLARDIVMTIVLLIGLLNQTIGIYAIAFCLSLQIFDLVRHFFKTHIREQISKIS